METPEPPSGSVAICVILALVIVVGLIGRVLNWVYLRPKRIERCLREQQLKGSSYRLGFGDLKEMSKMIQEAKSKPINLADDIVPRVVPFHHQLVQTYGENSFTWFGPTPVVSITNPEEIRDILNHMFVFQKPPASPLAKLLVTGLIDHEGETWVKHRKIINPAFHLEKLKLMLPAFYQCCNEMVDKWETLVSERGCCELDVWPFFHSMTGDVISRTAFGSSYEEGRRIFQLQIEQADLTTKVLRSFYIPGWRYTYNYKFEILIN